MPKVKTSLTSKINDIIRKYPNVLERDNNKLFCKLCLTGISFDAKPGKYNVESHIKSKGHQNKVESGQSFQSTIINGVKHTKAVVLKNEFFADTTKALIESNKPLENIIEN